MRLPEYFYFRVKPDKEGMTITLEDASDADVVEVVRCCNCLEWSEYDGTNGEPNCGWCEILNRNTYCQFYCADGARKDYQDTSSKAERRKALRQEQKEKEKGND